MKPAPGEPGYVPTFSARSTLDAWIARWRVGIYLSAIVFGAIVCSAVARGCR